MRTVQTAVLLAAVLFCCLAQDTPVVDPSAETPTTDPTAVPTVVDTTTTTTSTDTNSPAPTDAGSVTPVDTGAVPTDSVTPTPADNNTPPADNSTVPVDNSIVPIDNSTVPVDNTTVPVDNPTPPDQNATLPPILISPSPVPTTTPTDKACLRPKPPHGVEEPRSIDANGKSRQGSRNSRIQPRYKSPVSKGFPRPTSAHSGERSPYFGPKFPNFHNNDKPSPTPRYKSPLRSELSKKEHILSKSDPRSSAYPTKVKPVKEIPHYLPEKGKIVFRDHRSICDSKEGCRSRQLIDKN